jgi:DNA polymerase III subunit gamma/tau
VKLEGTELLLAPSERLQPDFLAALAARLKEVTGQRWTVQSAEGEHEPSMRDRELAEEDAARAAILESPLVQATLQAFPEAELVDYSVPEPRSLAS